MPAEVLLVPACALAACAAADRMLAWLAVRLAGRLVARAAGLAPAPLVRIVGVPFLTQLVAGRLRDVRVTVAPFTAGSVEISGLDVRLMGVRARPARRGAGGSLVAGRATGTMTIALSALECKLPEGITLTCRDGELRIAGSVLRMPVSGTLGILARPRRVYVTPRVLGVPSLVGFALAVPVLPPEMVIGSVLVTDSGLQVRTHGENVSLTALISGPVSADPVNQPEPDAPAKRLLGCGGTRRRREAGAS